MPSPLGELGLDIKPFQQAWNQALSDVKKLEPQVKAANAQLRMMEQQFSKLGTASGYSTKQIDKQAEAVQDLRVKLKETKADARAFSEGLGEGGLSKLGKLFTAGAVLSFAHSLATVGREGSALSKTLDELDRSTYADKFTEADKAARGFKGAVLDLYGAIANIPVVGQAFETITAPFMRMAKQTLLMRDFRREMNVAAAGSSELIGKMKRLDEVRSKLRQSQADDEKYKFVKQNVGILGVGGTLAAIYLENKAKERSAQTEKALSQLEESRANVLEEIVMSFDDEAKARNAGLAGSEKEAKLAGLRLDKEKQIADLKESIKNSVGEETDEGVIARVEGEAKITEEYDHRRGLVHNEGEMTIKTLEAASELANESLRGIKGQETAARKTLELAIEAEKLAKGTGEENEKRAKANVDIAEDGLKQAKEASEDEISALRLQTTETEARFVAMTGVANQAAIESRFQTEIVKQLRAGSIEAATMLQIQKEIAQNEEKVRRHDETPKQRRDARRESRIKARKINQEDAREKDRQRRAGLGGGEGGGIDGAGGLESGGLKSGGIGKNHSVRAPEIVEQIAKDRISGQARTRNEAAMAGAAASSAQVQAACANIQSIAAEITGKQK